MNSGDPAPALPARRGRPSGGGRLAGRIYLERGRPVVVLAGWGPGGGPRNVLVRHASGALVVRPFRGLRRPR